MKDWKTWFMIYVVLLVGLLIVGAISQQEWILERTLAPALALGLAGGLVIQFAIPVKRRDDDVLR